jgi:hypothetical protein
VPLALGPLGQSWLVPPTNTGASEIGFTLHYHSSEPCVTLGIYSRQWSVVPIFDPSGNLIASGHTDGTISLFNLDQIRTRLAQLGLAWQAN